MLSRLEGYHRPASIPEAVALLEKNSGTILVIAGGTKLVSSQNDTVQELVDITALGLNYIREEAGMLRIGATTTLQTLVESPTVKSFYDGILSKAILLNEFSRTRRNAATLGGEIISTTPLSILYCTLLVLQAQVRITGGEEFALAMNIFLNKKELSGGLLLEILVPKCAPKTYAAISAVSTFARTPPVLAACARLTVGSGRCHEVKIGLTGTHKVPQRYHEAETFLEGQPLTAANLEMVAQKIYASYHPISDKLASEEYRKEACQMVVKNALKHCWQQAEEAL